MGRLLLFVLAVFLFHLTLLGLRVFTLILSIFLVIILFGLSYLYIYILSSETRSGLMPELRSKVVERATRKRYISIIISVSVLRV